MYSSYLILNDPHSWYSIRFELCQQTGLSVSLLLLHLCEYFPQKFLVMISSLSLHYILLVCFLEVWCETGQGWNKTFLQWHMLFKSFTHCRGQSVVMVVNNDTSDLFLWLVYIRILQILIASKMWDKPKSFKWHLVCNVGLSVLCLRKTTRRNRSSYCLCVHRLNFYTNWHLKKFVWMYCHCLGLPFSFSHSLIITWRYKLMRWVLTAWTVEKSFVEVIGFFRAHQFNEICV